MAMPSTGAWGSHGPVTGLRNVGGDDGRHDGSVGCPHAARLCYDQPQPVLTGRGVPSPLGVPRGYIDTEASAEEQQEQISQAQADVEVSGEYDGNDGP